MKETDSVEKGLYRIYDQPPVVTDDLETVQEAKDLGYRVEKVKVTKR